MITLEIPNWAAVILFVALALHGVADILKAIFSYKIKRYEKWLEWRKDQKEEEK